MKRISPFLSILMLLALGACTLPVPGGQSPTATISVTEAISAALTAPTETLAPTQPPAATEPPPAVEAAPTETLPAPQPTPTPTPLPPTPEPQAAAAQPTATQPAPTASPTPASTIDPETAFGEPSYQNPMQVANLGEWAQAETDLLPDNRNIRLRFKDGELYVTGKRLGFSTWWFSYHTLSDAYIEMTFETEDCSGDDAYGIIFRGPPHLAGTSYGYVAAFTCSGKVWVYRLDDANPWEAETLVEPVAAYAIRSGHDEENVIGVRAEGERFIIYANGVQVAEVEDDHFEKGRVGVFVRAAAPDAYTYRVTNFAYWILEEDQ